MTTQTRVPNTQASSEMIAAGARPQGGVRTLQEAASYLQNEVARERKMARAASESSWTALERNGVALRGAYKTSKNARQSATATWDILVRDPQASQSWSL